VTEGWYKGQAWVEYPLLGLCVSYYVEYYVGFCCVSVVGFVVH
jgi:hypothetical protein